MYEAVGERCLAGHFQRPSERTDDFDVSFFMIPRNLDVWIVCTVQCMKRVRTTTEHFHGAAVIPPR